MEKRNYKTQSRKLNGIFVVLIVLLSLNIIYKSFELYVPDYLKVSSAEVFSGVGEYLSEQIFIKSVPLLSYTFYNQESLERREQLQGYETSYFNAFFSSAVPLMDYVLKYESIDYQTVAELYPKIEFSRKEGIEISNLEELDNLGEDENHNRLPVEGQMPSSYVYTFEELNNLDFLAQNIYTFDSSIKPTMKDLKIEKYLETDLTVDFESNKEEPKILIFHTHSQEAFIDSRVGVMEDTVVGLGDELARILEDEYGVKSLHHKGVYDLVDGKLDRAYAYVLTPDPINKILEENPSIEVVIDLHRDGVDDNVHLVTEIDGRPTAKIMFFNGLSRTLVNGEMVDYYLKNPHVDVNMAFSLQMQLKASELFPGFTRKVYLKPLRFNMHLAPKFLFVEAGAQTNTVEEAKNAMIPLAEILYEVLSSK
jgi:stage II sporulation protein P